MSLNAKIQQEQVTQTIMSLIKMQANQRAKRWFVTINNYIQDDILFIESDTFQSLCKYIVYGKEEAPTTGTKHIHLYFRLVSKLYKNSIKKMFPRGIIEVAKGDEVSCFQYCSKEGNYKEFGQRLKNVENWVTKVEKLKQLLRDLMEKSWEEFEANHPYEAFYHKKKLEEYKFTHQEVKGPWNGELSEKNIWVFGKPGCGKSMWAHKQAEQHEIYIKNVNKWWDGYVDGPVKAVIVEDFPIDDKNWLINILKIWADRYPFNGEIKGGTVKVTPGRWILIITSNHSIEEVFKNCPIEDVDAIKRRFKEIKMEANSVIQWTRVPKDQLDQ